MNQKLSRRQARENAFLAAFSASFGEDEVNELLAERRTDEEYPLDAFGEKTVRDYYLHTAEIDDLIKDRLKGWTMSRVSRVSMTVLRVALSEILYGDEKKPSVTINEAVELVKKYGAESDYQFVNGLLGRVVRDLNLVEEQPDTPTQEQDPASC